MDKEIEKKEKYDYEKPPKPEHFGSFEKGREYGLAVIHAAPKELRSEWAKKANKASLEKRMKNKRARDILEQILSIPAKKLDLEVPISELEDATLYDVIMAAQALKAAAGELKSAEFVRDTVGDAPVAESKIETSGFEAPENSALLAKIAKRLDIKEDEE